MLEDIGEAFQPQAPPPLATTPAVTSHPTVTMEEPSTTRRRNNYSQDFPASLQQEVSDKFKPPSVRSAAAFAACNVHDESVEPVKGPEVAESQRRVMKASSSSSSTSNRTGNQNAVTNLPLVAVRLLRPAVELHQLSNNLQLLVVVSSIPAVLPVRSYKLLVLEKCHSLKTPLQLTNSVNQRKVVVLHVVLLRQNPQHHRKWSRRRPTSNFTKM